MRRSTVYVRRIYDKLMLAVGVEVKSASAGLTQYVKAGVYNPDHGVTPLVLTPTVSAQAADLTPEQKWSVGKDTSNAGVGGSAWKIDGAAVSSVWTEGTDYELSDDGKELWIYRNIPAGSGVSVSCCLLVYDSRTGLTIPVETDGVPLSTVQVEDAPMRLSTDCENVLWDVTADDLWEWEYRAARGYTQLMTQEEAANDACYKKHVAFCVTRGGGQLSEGYGIWIKDGDGADVAYITASGTLVNNSPVKILELTTAGVTFDCRVIEDELFKVYALDSAGAIQYDTLRTIHVKAARRDYDAPEIANNSDYTVSQQLYNNYCRVRCNGEEMEHPECWLRIEWKTAARTEGAAETAVGAGDRCVFAPNEAGGGSTASDNGFDMIVDTDYLPALTAAVDEDGSFWTDESGNVLLI